MINQKLMHSIIRRLIRHKGETATIVWVVRHVSDIRYVVKFFEGSSAGFEYKASARTLRFGNITVRFILADEDGERLCGLNVDEVIIDES